MNDQIQAAINSLRTSVDRASFQDGLTVASVADLRTILAALEQAQQEIRTQNNYKHTAIARAEAAEAEAKRNGEQVQNYVVECAHLRAQLAAAQEDTKRLDWLLKNGQVRYPHIDRAAIDAARKEVQP